RRRCSGLSTKNSPPNDQKACPPTLALFSWSRISTRRPCPTNSHAATKPDRPAPTMIASTTNRAAGESLMYEQGNAPGRHVNQTLGSGGVENRLVGPPPVHRRRATVHQGQVDGVQHRLLRAWFAQLTGGYRDPHDAAATSDALGGQHNHAAPPRLGQEALPDAQHPGADG